MIVKAQGDVLSLSGSLTENHWLTLKAAANLALKRHPDGIIIDCGGLVHCTSEGAHTFSDAVSYIESHEARIILVNLPPEILETLQSVPGVRSTLCVAQTVEEARASLRLGGWTKGPVEKSAPVVMVPLLGGEPPRSALHLACVLTREREGRLYLVYILEVPRALALSAPLSEQEQVAQSTLEAAEVLVKREGLVPMRYIRRGRELTQGLIEAATQLQADVMVVGLSPGSMGERNMAKVEERLRERAPCDIIVSSSATVPGSARETQRLQAPGG